MSNRARLILLATLLPAFFSRPAAVGAAIALTRGPYLQQASTNGMVVRWRTSTATTSALRLGPAPGAWSFVTNDATVVTDHVLTLSGLAADTIYAYEVGSLTNWFPGASNQVFTTPPAVGTDKPTRFWVLGDSGLPGADANAVRNAYAAFTGTRPTDLWLMLGDNAYEDGTDAQHQAAVFDQYPAFLRSSVLWPTLGNHDTKATDASGQPPYFAIFTLPQNAEAGGVASGTEKYYSFDYANVHFVCLDSMSSDRRATGPMASWLRADLAATTQEWIIAYFHHPPYSKGSHDSDADLESIEMRQNFLPILESEGVDLVLCGHSHSYERSFLLDGHYGNSSSLTVSMRKDAGDGRLDGTGAYTKGPHAPTPQGAVYAVAGSSSSVNGGELDHPAMFTSLNVLGSVVVDITGNRLDLLFLTATGAAGDYFTLLKPPPPPTNAPAAPLELTAAAAGPTQILLSWTDASDNDDGFKLERSTNSVDFVQFAAVSTAVTQVTDAGLAPDRTYFYRVRSYNAAGNSAYSDLAQATTPPVPPDFVAPAAVSNLTVATVTSNGVTLLWTAPGDDGLAGTATRYDVRLGTAPITEANWAAVTPLSGVPAPAGPGNSQAFSIVGLAPGVTYYFAVKTADDALNESPLSNVPFATIPVPPLTPDGMRVKWFISLTGGTNYDLGDPDVQALLARGAASANAHWSTLVKSPNRTFLWPDLTSTANSSEITTAYNRLFAMALAWASWGGPLHTNAALGADLVAALDWMYANRYNEDESDYDNWWDWEIGAPMALNDICVLLYDRLTAAQLANHMNAVNEFTPSPDLTGANRVWKTRVVAIRGALVKDASKLAAARDAFTAVFPYVTSSDGFYADGSFLQHTRHPYTGGYGASLLDSLGRVVTWLQNSTWAVTNPARTNVANWVLQSYAPVLYRGALMDLVRGREIARIASDHDRGRYVMESLLRVVDFLPAAEAARLNGLLKYYSQADATTDWSTFGGLSQFTKFRRLLADPGIAPAPEPVFHKLFPSMACAVHARPGFGLAIRMSSSRVYNYESINNENLRGWFTGDGMTYLYNGDLSQFSEGFWPTVNPYRLPGTTVDTTARANASGQEYLSPATWVGGASLEGSWGAVGFELRGYNSTLTARKSWFLFDDEIVCLGANINGTSANRVETTIENRRLAGDGRAEFQINGLPAPATVGWSNSVPASWCWLDGAGGYYLPGNPTVKALRERRSGLWSDINQRYGVGSATNTFLTLWFDHGIRPVSATYSYVLLPNQSAADTAAYAASPQSVIVQNNAQAQAARELTLGLFAVNFWSAGTVDFVTCGSPASVLTRETDDRLLVGLADPTQGNSGSIQLTLGRSALALVSADPGVTVSRLTPTIQLSASMSNRRGQTVRAVFTKAPPTVLLNTPSNHAVLATPASVPWAATVGSNGWAITKVEFLANGTPIGESFAPPYTANWIPAGGGAFTLTARASYAAGTASSAPSVTIQYRLPPAAPRNLSAAALSTNQIALAWTETATDEDSFRIERSTNGVEFAPCAMVGPNVTNAIDSGLAPDTTYHYRVRAHNGVGDSDFSAPAQATTFPPPPDTNAPAAITNLALVLITSNRVALRWTAPGDDDLAGTAFAYDLRVSTEPIVETNWDAALPVAGLPAPAEAGSEQFALVNDLLPATAYFFAIKTIDETNNISPLSNVPGVLTPAPEIPSMPTELNATALATNEIALAWTDNSDSEDGFHIERSTNGLDFVPLGGVGPGVTAATDYDVLPSTTYWYRVAATNAFGVSPPSNLDEATTPDPIPPDSTPPAAVTNLALASVTTNSVLLRWTAPGDDGPIGTAASYDLRCHTNPITVANWDLATAIPGLPAPQPAGSNETVQVLGLARGTTYYFALKTLDDSNFVSQLSNVPYTTTAGLPAPWLDTDIGSVGLAGSALRTNNAFLVRGAGADISSKADGFHYLYQPASGDCEIIARITVISNTSSSAKAGVMIRESLTNNARFAATLLQPDRKMLWLYRSAAGDSASSSSASGSFTPPAAWVRVTRTNSTFASYSSLDGVTWKLIKSKSITMGTNVFIGVAVTSKSTSRLNASTFDPVKAGP